MGGVHKIKFLFRPNACTSAFTKLEIRIDDFACFKSFPYAYPNAEENSKSTTSKNMLAGKRGEKEKQKVKSTPHRH